MRPFIIFRCLTFFGINMMLALVCYDTDHEKF
jgi:hypothetical protein